MKSVAIVVPSGDLIHADTAWCIWQNSFNLFGKRINNTVINPQCSLVQKGRWTGVKQAIEAECTHVMFVDSDMVMPPHTIATLVEHNRDIVGCYARKRDGSNEICGDVTDPSKKGLHEVRFLGTGMLLININVFKKIPEPWFNVGFSEGEWISEDMNFCAAAKKHGYKVWCDLDLSPEIGHIGRTVFK